MDLKIFTSTFAAVFFAELADKTQFIGIGMSMKSRKPLEVWLGSVLAYMIITAITVLIGSILGKYLKPELLRYIGASLFFIIGILMFVGKI